MRAVKLDGLTATELQDAMFWLEFAEKQALSDEDIRRGICWFQIVLELGRKSEALKDLKQQIDALFVQKAEEAAL